MTDYRRLAEAANRIDDTVKRLLAEREEMQSAIEALQEQIALLGGTIESRDRNIAELQAENERLIQEQAAWRSFTEMANNTVSKAESERDALQSRLDAMGKGEAVASIYISAMGREFDDWKCELPEGRNLLYAAPKALAPMTDEQQRTNRHQISAMQSAYNVLTNGPMVRGCKYSREFAILELKRCLDAAHGIHAKGGQL